MHEGSMGQNDMRPAGRRARAVGPTPVVRLTPFAPLGRVIRLTRAALPEPPDRPVALQRTERPDGLPLHPLPGYRAENADRLGTVHPDRSVVVRPSPERPVDPCESPGGWVRPLEEALSQGSVGPGVKGDAHGRFSVPAGPTGLLVVGLEGGRELDVEHRPDVGFVDAHAEGVGSHDHPALSAHEPLLHARALRAGQAGVIGVDGETAPCQMIPNDLHGPARRGIDDGQTRELAKHTMDGAHPCATAPSGQDRPVEVGSVERPDDLERVAKAEVGGDVVSHGRRGAGGERQRRAVESSRDGGDAPVGWPEVVAPLADAMRLVDGDETHANSGKEVPKRVQLEPLGRDEEESDAACADPIHDAALRRHGLGPGEGLGLETDPARPLDLVLHEGDEWRDDQRQAIDEERRHLVADALASAGGKNAECIPTMENGPYELLLARPEAVVSERSTEDRSWIVAGMGAPAHP